MAIRKTDPLIQKKTMSENQNHKSYRRQLRFTQFHCLLAGLLLMLASFSAASAVTEIDHIVAIVNEDIITNSELEDEMARIALQIQSRGQRLPPRDIMQRQVLERIILTRLQIQTAKQAGITVSDATVANMISNIASQNGISVRQLRETLESDGLDFQAFRDDLKQQILLRQLQQRQVINRIMVTEQELKRELEKSLSQGSGRKEVQLQHILVGTPEGATEEEITRARTKAMQLVRQLQQGEDFTNLAIQESDGRHALEGGELGWFKPAQVPTLFVDAVFQLKPGEISEPIHSASGFHIVKLVAAKGAQRHVIIQTRARHILISTNEVVSDDDARLRLVQLRERIIDGDSFADLASSHSDDKGSAIRGGDLGWVNPGAMVPVFEQQMDDLAINQISQPFRTQFGWHIVQVLERRDYDSTDEVMKNNARVAVRKRKADEAIELWLQRLRAEAYVELRLE